MRAYERLLKYVKIHTTSDPDSGTHPSAEREFDLARMLEAELRELGAENVRLTENCIVYAEIPASEGCEDAPAIGFIAHMDTSPDASGENVKPVIHENYDGGDIVLPSGRVTSPDVFPVLKTLVGDTLITTDGTTLLGADDKAGIAEIMTAAERIISENRRHGKICIAFTPDEEIGEGTACFDVDEFGADFAYTLDGDVAGGIEYENFNAASATVTITGVNVHPGSAKGIMKNAAAIACEFNTKIGAHITPEHTEGREGFIHLTDIRGDVGSARLDYIIREHDKYAFAALKDVMVYYCGQIEWKYGEGTIDLEIKDSYYNMIEKITPCFHLVENARLAAQRAGLPITEKPVRGGTDGAMLSYMGLPCPNLGTGGFNFHGEHELVSVQQMDAAVEMVLNIADIYSESHGLKNFR